MSRSPRPGPRSRPPLRCRGCDQPVAQTAFAVTVQLAFVALISCASTTQVVALPDVRAPGSLCTSATLSDCPVALPPPPPIVLPAGQVAVIDLSELLGELVA